MRKLNLDWQGYYPFDERSVKDKVRDRSGIYKISIKQKNGSLKPVLIGQAASLTMKLLEQVTTREKTCITEQIATGDCRFKIAYLHTQEELDAAERALYKRYTPKCNDPETVPKAEDVEVDFN